MVPPFPSFRFVGDVFTLLCCANVVEGFMEVCCLVVQVGSSEMRDSGLTLKFEAHEKMGPYDVDFYTVNIAGVLSLDVRVRVAHRLLRRPQDAQTHFDIKINKLEVSCVPSILSQLCFVRGQLE